MYFISIILTALFIMHTVTSHTFMRGGRPYGSNLSGFGLEGLSELSMHHHHSFAPSYSAHPNLRKLVDPYAVSQHLYNVNALFGLDGLGSLYNVPGSFYGWSGHLNGLRFANQLDGYGGLYAHGAVGL